MRRGSGEERSSKWQGFWVMLAHGEASEGGRTRGMVPQPFWRRARCTARFYRAEIRVFCVFFTPLFLSPLPLMLLCWHFCLSKYWFLSIPLSTFCLSYLFFLICLLICLSLSSHFFPPFFSLSLYFSFFLFLFFIFKSAYRLVFFANLRPNNTSKWSDLGKRLSNTRT